MECECGSGAQYHKSQLPASLIRRLGALRSRLAASPLNWDGCHAAFLARVKCLDFDVRSAAGMILQGGCTSSRPWTPGCAYASLSQLSSVLILPAFSAQT